MPLSSSCRPSSTTVLRSSPRITTSSRVTTTASWYVPGAIAGLRSIHGGLDRLTTSIRRRPERGDGLGHRDGRLGARRGVRARHR